MFCIEKLSRDCMKIFKISMSTLVFVSYTNFALPNASEILLVTESTNDAVEVASVAELLSDSESNVNIARNQEYPSDQSTNVLKKRPIQPEKKTTVLKNKLHVPENKNNASKKQSHSSAAKKNISANQTYSSTNNAHSTDKKSQQSTKGHTSTKSTQLPQHKGSQSAHQGPARNVSPQHTQTPSHHVPVSAPTMQISDNNVASSQNSLPPPKEKLESLKKKINLLEKKIDELEKNTSLLEENVGAVDEKKNVIADKTNVYGIVNIIEEKPKIEEKKIVVEEKSKIIEEKPKVVEEKPKIVEERKIIVEEKPKVIEEKKIILEDKNILDLNKVETHEKTTIVVEPMQIVNEDVNILGEKRKPKHSAEVKKKNHVKVSPTPAATREHVTVSKPFHSIRYNGSMWLGGGFIFTTGSLRDYIYVPLIDYQIGFSKSIFEVTPYDFLYGAFIFDYALKKIGKEEADRFYFSNAQLLLGYEQTFGTPYFSGFLEGGAMFQQRVLAIGNSDSPAMVYTPFFGGSFNGGFNIRICPKSNISYHFRLAMNVMFTDTSLSSYVEIDGQNPNVRATTYGPSLSFAVRI